MDRRQAHRPHPTRAIAAAIIASALVACSATPSPSSSPPATAAAPSAAVATTGAPTATATPTPRPIARNPAPVDAAVAYRPSIEPADFSTTIDNPFFPLVPGTIFIYEGGDERIEVTVTSDTRMVMGVETVVVRDIVTVGDTVTEDTFDWYAQDRAGNVWYFGEETRSFDGGPAGDPAGDPAGSWEAGVDGAQPGIVMLADPRGGDVYRQEFLKGEAEDLALVRRLDGTIKVRAGSYENALVTEEWTPLEPDAVEYKYYARGIGNVGERLVVGGNDTMDLVEVRQAGA
jgi:hypothetical protein